MSKRGRAQSRKDDLSLGDGSAHMSQTITRAEYFEGTLPPPEMLAQYESLQPGLIVWLMNRVESQQVHRMDLEQFAVKERYKQGSRGQLFAFLLGIATLLVAGYGFYLSQPLAGFGAVVVGIGSIASAYYVGQAREAREKKEKDEKLHTDQKAIQRKGRSS